MNATKFRSTAQYAADHFTAQLRASLTVGAVLKLLMEHDPALAALVPLETIHYWARAHKTPAEICDILGLMVPPPAPIAIVDPDEADGHQCPACGSVESVYRGDREVCANGCQR